MIWLTDKKRKREQESVMSRNLLNVRPADSFMYLKCMSPADSIMYLKLKIDDVNVIKQQHTCCDGIYFMKNDLWTNEPAV